MLNICKKPKETKIVVAMSGGVDSSTAAAFLKEAGYDVIGLTMQLYDAGTDLAKKKTCCAGQDIYDAKKVAEQISIPHYVLNYEDIFKSQVMDYFADSYLEGKTPIPCVKCNQTVKFKDMFKVAKDLGADALVTGHYVRKINGPNGAELHRALDHKKDQSYFLFATTKEQLEYIYFPLGEYTKAQTRNMALKYGLRIADKPDSQDICFVPNKDYANLVERLRPGSLDPGEIVHITGEKLGYHNGIINYTIGQRKGLGIAYKEPLYVIKIDINKKQVIVGPDFALDRSEFLIDNVNILEEKNLFDMDISVKIRSMHDPVSANITMVDNKVKVTLHIPQRAITPGQACVIYNKDRVLGGGWITNEIY